MADADPNQPLPDDYLKAHATDPAVVPYLTSEERRRLTRLTNQTSEPQPMLRSRTGALYQPPADSGVSDMIAGAREGINPMNYVSAATNALFDPIGAAGNLVMAGPRLIEGLLNSPAHTLGNLMGGAVLGQAAGSAVNALRPGVKGLANVESAKDAAQLIAGEGRLSAGTRLAQRVGAAMKNAPATPASAPAETPAAAPPVTAAPESAPTPPPTPKPKPRAKGPQAKPRTQAVADRMNLTPEELTHFRALVDEGYQPEDVMLAIQRNRLPQAWQNLPSDADVAAAVADRNATGRWPQDK